ncbi:hypothetical protein [Marinobacterium sp. BA1]|uniref:hypothetical protein n=1 Tax=Marinobacterium sp. BA1 TaxID=3138931 RepID=UPI0032E5EA06
MACVNQHLSEHDAAVEPLSMHDDSRWGQARVIDTMEGVWVDVISVNKHRGVQHFLEHFEAHVQATANYEPDLVRYLIGAELLVMYNADQVGFTPSLVDILIPDLPDGLTDEERQQVRQRLDRWGVTYGALVNPSPAQRMQRVGRRGIYLDA